MEKRNVDRHASGRLNPQLFQHCSLHALLWIKPVLTETTSINVSFTPIIYTEYGENLGALAWFHSPFRSHAEIITLSVKELLKIHKAVDRT